MMNSQEWPSCPNSPPQVVPLTILYATQTFTSLEVATQLAQRAARRGFKPYLNSMNAFPRVKLPDQKLVIFVCSTTGDGEVPQTMTKFWKFLLRRSLPKGILGDMRFAVFGLGDSSYPKFNAVARRLDVRLRQLGAKAFHKCGLGDDQSEYGVWGDLDTWCANGLWDTLLGEFPVDTTKYSIDDSPLLRPPVQVDVFVPTEMDLLNKNSAPFQCSFYQSTPGSYTTNNGLPVDATLLSNIRITSKKWYQDVRHLQFAFDASKTQGYEAGDVAVLFPRNGWWNSSLPSVTKPSPSDKFPKPLPIPSDAATSGVMAQVPPPTDEIYDPVHKKAARSDKINKEITCERVMEDPFISAVCQRLNLNPAHHIVSKDINWLPKRSVGGCSIRDLFTCYLDINGTPTRAMLEQLSFFAHNNEQRDKLLELASSDGTDLFHSYITRERRSFVEVLFEFTSIDIPLGHVLRLVPPIKPRYFSISSSPLQHRDQFHLTVAVVSFKTPWRRQRSGLCSNWLAYACPEAKRGETSFPNGEISNTVPWKIPIWFKKGSLRLPIDPISDSVLLVGPGTGVAPMRALIQRRKMLLQNRCPQSSAPEESSDPGRVGSCHLFFGCRRSDCDFYYSKEWKQLQKQGYLTGVYCAFSREKQRLKEKNPSFDDAKGRILPIDISNGITEAEVARTSGYVQRRLSENGALVWSVLRPASNGVLCLAGSAKGMPKDVKDQLVKIFTQHGEFASEVEGVTYLKQLERQGRFMCEAWA